MAILVCQLDSIWNEVQFRNGGHICDLDLKAGWHIPLIEIFRQKYTPLVWATYSTGSLCKDTGGSKDSFVLCLIVLTLSAHPLRFQHIQKTS